MPKRSAPVPGGNRPPGATVVRADDLELAKEDALLQLRIGRTAHLFAVGISGGLALDGVLLLFLFPHLLPLPGDATGLAALAPTFYLLVPVLAGLGISFAALITKWEAFQLWPWEPHFATTVGSVALNVVVAILYGLRVAGEGPLAHTPLYPWFIPLALAGISIAFLGLAMTWTAWGSQQWASATSAVLPLLTPVLVIARPTSTSTEADAIAVALFLSAILYQMSGSFLHLISSGTRPHEKELISAGQNRIVKLADETRQKEEALRFRESALLRRESDAENAEAAVQKQRVQLSQAQKELDERSSQDSRRAEELAQHERELAGRAAEVETIAHALEARVKSVDLREQEIARQLPQLAAREERVAQQEGDQARREAEVAHRLQDAERQSAAATETEARLEARRKQLDDRTAELLRREGDLTARGMPATGRAAGGAGPSVADAATSEGKLRALRQVLDEQNAVLGRRAREVTEREKSLSDALRQATDRQAALAARDAALAQREAGLGERLKAADERRAQYESAARDYQQRLQELGKRQIDEAQRRADLDRSMKTLGDRESALATREVSLRTALSTIDEREREVLAKERTLEAHEAELSLRRQEVARGGDLTLAGLAAVAAAEREELPASRPATRPARPPAAGAEPAPAAPSDAEGAGGLLVPTAARRYADRLPTGTARLDDLLLGGFPARSHVVLMGDAFVGKEVVLYTFLAEGLKRGEPVVLVTASRSPAEVSQSLGVVLPQFLEYEQLGMVTWVDASSSGGAPSPRRLVAKGSDDRAGLLSALVQVSKTIEETRRGPFRVGFLGLSAVFAHADERASFSFLQNVVGILKAREALAMYSLEGGALTEAQVESLFGRMDGAIVFRQDRDRTFLSVRGFGDVQTREWVECRATNRALIVGSFALERIR
jgi:KaiC/GvpD/RAD55 family RecA-like ATPase